VRDLLLLTACFVISFKRYVSNYLTVDSIVSLSDLMLKLVFLPLFQAARLLYQAEGSTIVSSVKVVLQSINCDTGMTSSQFFQLHY
jgi:hypothetical protein